MFRSCMTSREPAPHKMHVRTRCAVLIYYCNSDMPAPYTDTMQNARAHVREERAVRRVPQGLGHPQRVVPLLEPHVCRVLDVLRRTAVCDWRLVVGGGRLADGPTKGRTATEAPTEHALPPARRWVMRAGGGAPAQEALAEG
jgi:hypothetical protein